MASISLVLVAVVMIVVLWLGFRDLQQWDPLDLADCDYASLVAEQYETEFSENVPADMDTPWERQGRESPSPAVKSLAGRAALLEHDRRVMTRAASQKASAT